MNVEPDLLLIIDSAGVGDGEPDLGEKLMKSFLTMLLESKRLPARCIFLSSGIFLTTEGSPVLGLLRQLETAGCEVLSCGTCLEYYSRTDALQVGTPTNMRATVDAMLSSTKILRP